MKNWVTACLRVSVGLNVAPVVIGWGRGWGGESQDPRCLGLLGVVSFTWAGIPRGSWGVSWVWSPGALGVGWFGPRTNIW